MHCTGETPTIKLGNGQPYREGALWKDIYQAMLNAKHFIYIAGEHVLPLVASQAAAGRHVLNCCWVEHVGAQHAVAGRRVRR